MTNDKETRKHLKTLEAEVHYFLAHMDVLMLKPNSVERGQAIASLCNKLDMANQVAARFGLGVHRVGGKLKRVSL
jgi:hypothetical protein